ncbi:MAG TPA: thermopsin family protease [Thermoplasmata archaeon]|nr:thermopsin family protease [Thermoplasmata archaeon]
MGDGKRLITLIAATAAILAVVGAYGAGSTAHTAGAPAVAAVPSVTGNALPIVSAGATTVKIASVNANYAHFPPKLTDIPRTVGRTSGGGTGAQPALVCSTAPCPMGITDYGVSSSDAKYSYKALDSGSYWDSGTAFAIGTAKGGGCLDPDAESETCFTIQQNQVTQGLYSEGVKGEYWAQNVPEVAYDESCSSPCVSGTYSVTWLDNIWNFSYDGGICPSDTDTGPGCVNPATIIGNQAGHCSSTGGAPELYLCVGPTTYDILPPFTINAWTNVGTFGPCAKTSTYTCVNFYGEVTKGTSVVFAEYYDGVKFLAGPKGTGSPSFYVKDALSPVGLPYDFEWVFGGPGGGSTNSIETYGDMQSYYCTTTSACEGGIDSYHFINHAWSSGYDTAESISDVYVVPTLNQRDTAVLYFASDNPDTSIW